MSDIKDLVDALNLPKTVLEKADAFLRTRLGPATVEAGEPFADAMFVQGSSSNGVDISQIRGLQLIYHF